MKSICVAKSLSCLIAASALILAGIVTARAQGTVAFDSAASFSGTNYYESGMRFHVVIPSGISHDDMGGVPGGGVYGNLPYNNTAYMVFFRQSNPSDFVTFSLTNGYTFGLTSVQLADPTSPSSSLLPISFIGFLGNGLTVTNTFTTPGGGATTFASYTFNSGFSSGLTSVDIFAPRWAMDNLTFGNVAAPEPGTGSLLVIGWLAFVIRRSQTRRKT